MKPDLGDSKVYAGWLKLPNPLENKEGDIAINELVTVTEEFKTPTNTKLQSFLVGQIQTFKEDKFSVGMNKTSYLNIAKVFGEDTILWVGKTIRYLGLKKFAKGTGHYWEAVK